MNGEKHKFGSFLIPRAETMVETRQRLARAQALGWPGSVSLSGRMATRAKRAKAHHEKPERKEDPPDWQFEWLRNFKWDHVEAHGCLASRFFRR